MYPKTFLKQNTLPEEKGTVFVLMAFATDFDPVFAAIKRTLEGQELLLRCYRADEVYRPEPIIESILRGIVTAELIVADVTGRNPNVFYELGIAHAVKDNCVILTQAMEDVPFDLRHLRCIVYENTLKGAEQLRLALTNTVRSVLPPGDDEDAVKTNKSHFGAIVATELSYERSETGYQSDRSKTERDIQETRRKLFEKATAAIAAVAGLETTKVEGVDRISFSHGFAVSDTRDESVGGQRGVKFATVLQLAVNANKSFSAADIAKRLGEKPVRISFVFDRTLDIPALFRLASSRGLGLEGLTDERVEISLDALADGKSYKQRDWRVLATNSSGTGKLELFIARGYYRTGAAHIEAELDGVTPDRIYAVLDGKLSLGSLIGDKQQQ
jgi:hypothetical protein